MRSPEICEAWQHTLAVCEDKNPYQSATDRGNVAGSGMPEIKTSSSTRSARHNRRYVSKIDDGKPAVAIYDAFISYSHAKDKPIAGALQSVIQRLGKPWYRRRALRVFRDDTSLSATPHLWPHDRAGARTVALLHPARVRGSRGLEMGQQAGRPLA